MKQQGPKASCLSEIYFQNKDKKKNNIYENSKYKKGWLYQCQTKYASRALGELIRNISERCKSQLIRKDITIINI